MKNKSTPRFEKICNRIRRLFVDSVREEKRKDFDKLLFVTWEWKKPTRWLLSIHLTLESNNYKRKSASYRWDIKCLKSSSMTTEHIANVFFRKTFARLKEVHSSNIRCDPVMIPLYSTVDVDSLGPYPTRFDNIEIKRVYHLESAEDWWGEIKQVVL